MNQDRLVTLKNQGADSALLEARLAFIEDEGMRKDLVKLKGKPRCYPELLPTQASLRWSTKNPNLGGFVREFWTQHSGIITPDPSEWWLEWDFKGIEARIFTAYSGDLEDIVAHSTNKTWCGRCGHAHDAADVLACWNSGGRGIIRPSQINERSGCAQDSSDRPANDRQECDPTGSGSIPNSSSDVWTPVAIPSPEGVEGDACHASIRQPSNRVDDDSLSIHGSAAQGSNQEMSHILERSTSTSGQSMGFTCCACNCTNSTFSEPDIHTLTCLKYLFEWDTLPSDWKGKTDERRVRAKNFRYGVLQYGQDARAVLGMPGIGTLGLDRDTLVARARRFLAARPRGVAWKEQTWRECTTPPYCVRTFMGHRRYLFGDEDTKKKTGTAHKISGSVANIMAWCLIQIHQRWPSASLILNKHDGAIIAFPFQGSEAGSAAPSPSDWGAVRALVEREWEVGPEIRMGFPAEWHVRTPHLPSTLVLATMGV